MPRRIGAWLVGARGGLATTTLVGARAIARGRASLEHLPLERPPYTALQLMPVADIVFGGCDLRQGSLVEAGLEIAAVNRSLDPRLVDDLRDDLTAIDADIGTGIGANFGRAIEALVGRDVVVAAMRPTLRERIATVEAALDAFVARHRLDDVVVVNLASTEPPLELDDDHRSLARLDALLDRSDEPKVRSSLLYAYAAVSRGHPFVNFTPSNAAVVPAILELAARRGAPIAGSDGKTGETLVKTALAPMFRDRALRVLSWQGYNILGDRDGRILSDSENLSAKVRSKDQSLASILGYRPHSHVGIDFVPSLDDLKTAWDHIHFEGFLGHRMTMQFIWQGCDSILAAPLVLDLIRLADVAHRRGEAGPMRHTASFFKSPIGCDQHDFHAQIAMLQAYAAAASAAGGSRA
jgi:myo-inositol-1-phosphate synthase